MSDTANPVQAYQDGLVQKTVSVVRPAGGVTAYVGYSVVGQITDPSGQVHDVLAINVINKSDPINAAVQLASREALTDALNAVASAITSPNGLAVDILNLTSAVGALASPIDAQSSGMAHLSAQADAQTLVLQALLAQQQSNGQAQAAILASMLRQEANQLAILAATNGIDADAKTEAAQAHADAQAELTGIQATNAGIATAHTDAMAQLAATQAAQAQAHTDAQAQTAALALIHSDDVATQAALATLHTDDQGLQTALTSLLSAIGMENATLSAISLSDAGTLATLKAILAGGTPFSASPAAGATATLFQAGANGSVITALGATSTSTLGTLLLSIFSTPSATGASGTLLQTVELVVGGNAPVLQNVAIPANAYVRATASLAGASVFGARKDL